MIEEFKLKMRIFVSLSLIKIFIVILAISTYSQIGKSVEPIKLKNVQDEETNFPNIGRKVIVVFYLDPDVQELNEPLSDALDAEKFPTEKLSVVGIVNCKDTWLPNAGIRAKARKKQERFPKSVILLDEEHSLAKAWKLEKCNDRLIVLIIGLDSKINYFKPVESLEESKKSIPELLQRIKAEINVQANIK